MIVQKTCFRHDNQICTIPEMFAKEQSADDIDTDCGHRIYSVRARAGYGWGKGPWKNSCGPWYENNAPLKYMISSIIYILFLKKSFRKCYIFFNITYGIVSFTTK